MKSSIKIDFTDRGQGAGLEPVIKVKQIRSDDPRDSLIQTFFQSLQGNSSWLQVEFHPSHHESPSEVAQDVFIYPVKPRELPEMIQIATLCLPQSPYDPPFLPQNNSFMIGHNQDGLRFKGADFCLVITDKNFVIMKDDLLMDDQHIIGRVNDVTEGGEILIQPINIGAFHADMHFKPGTKATVIQRTRTPKISLGEE